MSTQTTLFDRRAQLRRLLEASDSAIAERQKLAQALWQAETAADAARLLPALSVSIDRELAAEAALPRLHDPLLGVAAPNQPAANGHGAAPMPQCLRCNRNPCVCDAQLSARQAPEAPPADPTPAAPSAAPSTAPPAPAPTPPAASAPAAGSSASGVPGAAEDEAGETWPPGWWRGEDLDALGLSRKDLEAALAGHKLAGAKKPPAVTPLTLSGKLYVVTDTRSQWCWRTAQLQQVVPAGEANLGERGPRPADDGERGYRGRVVMVGKGRKAAEYVLLGEAVARQVRWEDPEAPRPPGWQPKAPPARQDVPRCCEVCGVCAGHCSDWQSPTRCGPCKDFTSFGRCTKAGGRAIDLRLWSHPDGRVTGRAAVGDLGNWHDDGTPDAQLQPSEREVLDAVGAIVGRRFGEAQVCDLDDGTLVLELSPAGDAAAAEPAEQTSMTLTSETSLSAMRGPKTHGIPADALQALRTRGIYTLGHLLHEARRQKGADLHTRLDWAVPDAEHGGLRVVSVVMECLELAGWLVDGEDVRPAPGAAAPRVPDLPPRCRDLGVVEVLPGASGRLVEDRAGEHQFLALQGDFGNWGRDDLPAEDMRPTVAQVEDACATPLGGRHVARDHYPDGEPQAPVMVFSFGDGPCKDRWRTVLIYPHLSPKQRQHLYKQDVACLGELAAWLADGHRLEELPDCRGDAGGVRGQLRKLWESDTDEGRRGEYPDWLGGPDRPPAQAPSAPEPATDGEDGDGVKAVFTTGEVAKMCRVAPRTVSKWFDSGKLKGYRIPGSNDRRIPREQLARFLKENGMEVPAELGAPPSAPAPAPPPSGAITGKTKLADLLPDVPGSGLAVLALMRHGLSTVADLLGAVMATDRLVRDGVAYRGDSQAVYAELRSVEGLAPDAVLAIGDAVVDSGLITAGAPAPSRRPGELFADEPRTPTAHGAKA